MRPATVSAFCFSSLPLCALTATAQSCSPLGDVKITFFGWPDNSPAGAGIAWTKCGHSVAGGSGSYDDPITFATATDGDFAVCDIVYLPYVRKYARYEDDCEQCKTDWDSSHQYHIDLWTGSSKEDGGSTQVDCENSLPGGSQTIVRNPPSNLPTDNTAFFSDGNCNKKTYSVESDSSLCSGSGSGDPYKPHDECAKHLGNGDEAKLDGHAMHLGGSLSG